MGRIVEEREVYISLVLNRANDIGDIDNNISIE